MTPEEFFNQPFTRTRSNFGKDAVNALTGIQAVLGSLDAGYAALNRNPPHNLFLKLRSDVDTLMAKTREIYIGPAREDE